LVGLAGFVFVVWCVVDSVRAAEKIDPVGTWTWVRELEGQEGQSVLTLSYKDGKLTGFYKRQGQVVPISNAKMDKNEISFDADGKWNDQKVHGKFKGKLDHDEINGTIEIVVEDGSLPLAWVAKRGIDTDDIAGTWTLKLVTPNGSTVEPRLKLSSEAGSLTGTITSSRFGEHEAKEIKLNGSELSWMVEFERNGQPFKGVYKGKVVGHAIKGTLAVDSSGNKTALEFSGERTTPNAGAGVKAEVKKTAQNPQTGTKASAKSAEGKSTERTLAKRRVIVMLKSRHEILVVYSSDGTGRGRGPVFSVRSTAGKEIANEISLKDLQASYPQIYEEYRTSFAGLWAGSVSERPVEKGLIEPSRKRLSSVNVYHGVDFSN